MEDFESGVDLINDHYEGVSHPNKFSPTPHSPTRAFRAKRSYYLNY